MKNLSYFDSFIESLNEEVQGPWDPKKAQSAIDEIIKRDKDVEPTGLSFNNIQKVFGTTDYTTRFRIAQALLLVGKNFFPVNKYSKDQSTNDNYRKTSDYTWTYYIGEKDQNLKMDKFSEALLKAVKPIVDDYAKEDNLSNGESLEYIKKTALEKPVVKQAKVSVDKISG
jgi:hypothetical protein